MVGRFWGGLHARRGRIAAAVVVVVAVVVVEISAVAVAVLVVVAAGVCVSIAVYESVDTTCVVGLHGTIGGGAIDTSIPCSSSICVSSSFSSSSPVISTSDIDPLLITLGDFLMPFVPPLVTIGVGGLPHTGLTFPPIERPRPQANEADNGRRTRDVVALQPMNTF